MDPDASNRVGARSIVLSLVRPPTADDFWRFLTHSNPIFACFVKYLSLTELIKLARSSPAIGNFLRIEYPPLDRIMSFGSPLDFGLFGGDLPNLRDAAILMETLEPSVVIIPELGPMDDPYFLRIFENSSVRRLIVTVKDRMQFLVFDLPIVDLIIQREENGYCPAISALLRSCSQLGALELRRCDLHNEDITTLRFSSVLHLRLVDLDSRMLNWNFMFEQFSQMRRLVSFGFTQMGIPHRNWRPRFYNTLIAQLRPQESQFHSLEISICEHLEFPILFDLVSLRSLTLHLYYRISRRAINKLCVYLRQLNNVKVIVKVFDFPVSRRSEYADRSWDIYWVNARSELLGAYPSLEFIPFHSDPVGIVHFNGFHRRRIRLV